MALTVVSEPLESNGNITDSDVVTGKTQVLYDFNEDDLGSKPNFRLEIEIRDATDSEVFLSGLFYVPNSDGDLRIDLADPLNFSILEKSNVTIFQRFFYLEVRYREVYTGFTGSFIGLTPLLVIRDGQLQLNAFPSIGGGAGANYINYLLFPNKTDNGFLTKFPQGKIPFDWINYFTVIYDSGLPGRIPGATIDYTIDRLDANKNFISEKTTFPDVYSTPTLVTGSIEYDAADRAAGAKYLELRIQDQAGTPNDLTKRYLFELVDECENSINVIWYNSLGGKSNFVFSYNQDVEEISEVGETIIPPLTGNIGTASEYVAQSAIQRRADNTSQRITCFADFLTADEVRALHELKNSDWVEVQVNKGQTALNAFVRVIVEDTYSTEYDTRGSLNSFTVKIRFPDNFDWFEAKDY